MGDGRWDGMGWEWEWGQAAERVWQAETRWEGAFSPSPGCPGARGCEMQTKKRQTADTYEQKVSLVTV